MDRADWKVYYSNGNIRIVSAPNVYELLDYLSRKTDTTEIIQIVKESNDEV